MQADGRRTANTENQNAKKSVIWKMKIRNSKISIIITIPKKQKAANQNYVNLNLERYNSENYI